MRITSARQEREECNKNSTLYFWREEFKNYYELINEELKESRNDDQDEKDEKDEKDHKATRRTLRDNQKYSLDQLYDKGGMLFLLNPFEQRNIQNVYIHTERENSKVHSKESTLTQDDLADVLLGPAK